MDVKIVEIVKTWFDKADAWQKDTFINLWKGADFDSIKDRAFKLALKEYNIESSSYSADTIFPKDIDSISKNVSNIVLNEISDVKGVCALAPTKSLKFGKGLNIVYGENGCGKSSYVKILKKAEDPKNPINIFGNIYADEKVKPSANLTFEYDGNINVETWTLSSKKSHHIRIYDTQIAKRFVENKNEVIYEPKLLSVFSEITRIIEIVNEKLSKQLSDYEILLLEPPEIISKCKKILEYDQLETNDELELFKKGILFSEAEDKKLDVIKETLSYNDPKGTKQTLLARKTFLCSICEELEKYSVDLDNSIVDKYKSSRRNQIDTKYEYDEFIKMSRDISIFKGLGSKEWNSLWQSSKKYMEYLAQIDNESFDRTQNYCVLCQQKLSNEGKEHISSLNEFYESKLKNKFDIADNNFKDLVQSISTLLDCLNVSKFRQRLISNAITDELLDGISDFVSKFYNRAKWLYDYYDDETKTEIPQNIDVSKIKSYFNAIISDIDDKIVTIDELLNDYESQLKSYHDLLANKWLSENSLNFDIKIKIFDLKVLLSKTKTNMVTSLKKNLSQIMITEAYIKKFSDELNKISPNHKINVQLSPSASKGKIYHKVSLIGAIEKRKTEEILSEGEYRAVSIAAFLADLSSWNMNQAFVFDDPINSLDQNFEENIAERLIQLSCERQVIIFTHRLAFAEMLNRIANENNKQLKQSGQNIVDVNYIKLSRNPLGDPDYQNDFSTFRLDKQLNNLDAPIKKAKELEEKGDHETADLLSKGLCSKFRDIVEKSIETTLLNNIVSRYSRNVSTQKIRYLKAINASDIDFLDSMMTKYSAFDHSQSTEKPVSLPSFNEFENDVNELKNWYLSFKQKQKIYD